MKKAAFILGLFILAGIAGGATAAVYTLNPPDGTQPDLQDMDHYSYYVWDFQNSFQHDHEAVTYAKLVFRNIYNNTATRNDALFVHLLDSGLGSAPTFTGTSPTGVLMHEWVKSDTNATNTTAASDQFAGSGAPLFTWYNVSDPEAGDVPKIIPVSYSTRKTLEYVFTATQLAQLNSYIANAHDFALGFDPDCHYVNDRVELLLVTTAVPEASAALTFLAGLAGLIAYRRKKRLS